MTHKKILLLLLILSVSFISAWPMQLLPNGTIIDLGTNETINGSSVEFILFNDTLYLIPKIEVLTNITNITNVNYYNITNVTNYENATYTGNFTNYTTQNITIENHTNIYNGTGGVVYTKEEIDNILTNFVPNSAIGGYVPRGEIGAYALKTELNTDTGSHVGTGIFWTMIILIILIIGALAYMLFTRDD